MVDDSAPKPQRPVVLVVCHTLSGHLQPLIRVASGLSSRGWDVAFLGPTAHRQRIEAAGAEFFALQGIADINDQAYYADPDRLAPGYKALPWTQRGKIDLRLQCLDTLPTQWENFKSTLVTLHERGRRVLVVAEAFFLGIMPLKYGAPLPPGVPVPRTVCVSITVPAIRSIDLPSFAYAAPFDQSDAGHARNQALWDKWTRSAADLTALLDKQLLASGADRGTEEPILSGANYRCHDAIYQVGVPGFEYPRSDWPTGFQFVGLVQGTPKGTVLPDPRVDWWDELKANSTLTADDPRRKKVVVVAQGTVEVEPNDLIIPTIRAFADRDQDVVVVAILGWKDASLAEFMPDGVVVPGNARIVDYLNYDAVLEHADAWVHNAGFGAVNHGIAHGVPMVVAGEGMDKTENARRVGWSGIGVDLATARPSVEQVRDAVESTLRDGGFKQRIEVLRNQSEALNPFDIISEDLIRMAGTG
ncbi:4'-demethylrebeccamycin synthase [Apiospora sp. TS-2023a]